MIAQHEPLHVFQVERIQEFRTVTGDHQHCLPCCRYQNNIPVTTWKHCRPIWHFDFMRSGVIVWFSNDTYESANLVQTRLVIRFEESYVGCVQCPASRTGFVCDSGNTCPKTSLQLWISCVCFTLGCWIMKKCVQSISYKMPIVTQDLYILLSVLGPIDQPSSNQ